MSLTVVDNSGPDLVTVMRKVFEDIEGPANDNCHWILFNNGTFYTFPKAEFGEQPDTNDLLGRALTMCKEASLISYDNNDCVRYYPYREEFGGHPVYVILSVLGSKLGWIVVGKTRQWAETEQEEAAVGYLARTKYELDCEEQKVLATSWNQDNE